MHCEDGQLSCAKILLIDQSNCLRYAPMRINYRFSSLPSRGATDVLRWQLYVCRSVLCRRIFGVSSSSPSSAVVVAVAVRASDGGGSRIVNKCTSNFSKSDNNNVQMNKI